MLDLPGPALFSSSKRLTPARPAPVLHPVGIGPTTADAGSAGAVLAALLAQLPDRARLIVRYRVAAAAHTPVSLELAITRPGGRPDDEDAASHLRTLAAWARLAAPELRMAEAERAPAADWGWRRLIRPEPTMLAAGIPASVGPRAIAAEGAEMALPHGAAPGAADLEACLAVLLERGQPAELELVLRQVRLDAAGLRALDAGIASLHALEYRAGNAGSDGEAIRRALAVATLFRRSGHGIGCALRLRLAGPAEPALADLLSRLFYGSAEAVAPAVRPDLSAAWPQPGPLPVVLPGAAMRHRLGLGAAVRPDARLLSERGLVLGTTSAGERVRIRARDQARHAYLIGATGVGKSTLIAGMIRQDIRAGRGVILIDPHGDLFADIRAGLPEIGGRPVVIADVSNTANPFGLNLLHPDGGDVEIERNVICNQLVELLSRVLYSGVPEAFGPMFDLYFRNTLMLLMKAGGPEASLADFERVLTNRAFRNRLLERADDADMSRFWHDVAEQATNEYVRLESITPYIVCKLTRFTGNPLIRPIITRPTTLDLAGAMDRGAICLVNLAKGVAGGPDAALLGGLIMTRLLTAVLRRAAQPQAARRVVRLYLDEFQSYATDALADLLAEARKFGLQCVLANQSLGQVDGRGGHGNVAHAVLANVGTVISFRVGPEDATRLAQWFEPELGRADLMRLADHEAAARLLVGGRPQPAFRFHTLGPGEIG